jgi:hypothetical protein
VADVIRRTGEVTREEISEVELTGFKPKMKVIKYLIRMKTTTPGTRPVN